MSLLLIDGPNMVNRGFHVMADYQTCEGEKIGGLLGYIRMLRSSLLKYREHTPILVWDSTSARRRVLIGDAYKAHRAPVGEPSPERQSIWDNIRESQRLTRHLGIGSVRVRGMEADDIIAHLARQNPGSVVISTDKDFLQLCHFDGITVDRPNQDVPLHKYNFKDVRKISPEAHRLSHMILGDPGDAVEGVPGVGWATVAALLEDLDPEFLYPLDLPAILSVASQSKNKRVAKIAEYGPEIELNYHLVDLIELDLLDSLVKSEVVKQLSSSGRIDYKGVAETFFRYELASFAADFEDRLLRTVETAFTGREVLV